MYKLIGLLESLYTKLKKALDFDTIIKSKAFLL